MTTTPPPQDLGTRALGAGLTLAVSVALFTYGGLWLDERCGSRPWFLVLGALLGMLGGGLHLVATLAPEMLPFTRRPPTPPPSGPERRGPPAEERPRDHEPPSQTSP